MSISLIASAATNASGGDGFVPSPATTIAAKGDRPGALLIMSLKVVSGEKKPEGERRPERERLNVQKLVLKYLGYEREDDVALSYNRMGPVFDVMQAFPLQNFNAQGALKKLASILVENNPVEECSEADSEEEAGFAFWTLSEELT